MAKLLATLALVFVVAAGPRAAAADEVAPPPPIEVTPEVEGASAAGAGDVERAQKLVKASQVAEAVAVFEEVARRWPASLHDCYLALAYLRAGALTRAQLLWDVATLRNGERPSWCTGDLGRQLSTAMRAAKYVPLTIYVTPVDAIVEVGGVQVRGIPIVWLPAGPQVVRASAPGRVTGTSEVEVASPRAQVTIELVEETPAIDPQVEEGTAIEPGAGQGSGTGTGAGAGTGTGSLTTTGAEPKPEAEVRPDPGPKDTALLLEPDLGVVTPPRARATPRWPGWVSLGAGGVLALSGAFFHMRAVDARDDGDGLATNDPDFIEADERFGRERTRTLVCYGVGAAAIGFGVWWLLGHSQPAEGPAVGASLAPGGGGGAVSVTWELP